MLKIIGGKFKGKNLLDIFDDIRPTTSRLREAVFNIIYSNFGEREFVFADLCCGTGSMGFEALSRGAKKTIAIDNDRKILYKMEKNAENLQIDEGQFECLQCDLSRRDMFPFSILKEVDIVFLDPPYNINLLISILKNLQKVKFSKDDVMIFVETDKFNSIKEEFENLKFLQKKKYCKTLLYVFEFCVQKVGQEESIV